GPAGAGANVVEDDGDDRRPGVGVEDLLQELDEGGAGGAFGDVVEPAPSGQLDGAVDAALVVLAGVITSCRSPRTIQLVVAVEPAANRARVVLEEGGDLGWGEGAQGEPDHHQAQGEAPGTLEQGHDLELAIGGRLGEDVGGTQEWTWSRWTW